MTRPLTSLLSLPDELLVRIFNHLAGQLRNRDHSLLPFMSFCRRLRQVVPTVLYRDVVFSPYATASPYFQQAVEENPSLGQLVRKLEMYDTGLTHRPHGSRTLAWERAQATTSTLARLEELTLLDMTTDEANAVLAALPSPTLRSLKLHLQWTTDPQHRQHLWTQLSRHPDLRSLECDDWSCPSEVRPPTIALAPQHFSLPKLDELHMTDRILIETFEIAALSLRDTLPSLRTLHIAITEPESISAVSAILSQPPSTLTTLKILSKSFILDFEVPSGYLLGLPPLRHLDLGPQTFTEAELLAYLPTASLESVGFDLHAPVTDRILEALTGPACPPQLRQIRLNHVARASSEKIAKELENWILEYCTFRTLEELALEVFEDSGPSWPFGGTEEGLRLALAAADANSIRVTGSALDCLDWDASLDGAFAEFLIEQTHEMADYDAVLARFAPDIVEWLKDYATDKAKLLRAHLVALELEGAIS